MKSVGKIRGYGDFWAHSSMLTQFGTCPFAPWPDTELSRAKRQKRAAPGSIFLIKYKTLSTRQTFTNWGGFEECQTLAIAWLSPPPQLSGWVCGCLVLAVGSQPACELLSGSQPATISTYNTILSHTILRYWLQYHAGDFPRYIANKVDFHDIACLVSSWKLETLKPNIFLSHQNLTDRITTISLWEAHCWLLTKTMTGLFVYVAPSS